MCEFISTFCIYTLFTYKTSLLVLCTPKYFGRFINLVLSPAQIQNQYHGPRSFICRVYWIYSVPPDQGLPMTLFHWEVPTSRCRNWRWTYGAIACIVMGLGYRKGRTLQNKTEMREPETCHNYVSISLYIYIYIIYSTLVVKNIWHYMTYYTYTWMSQKVSKRLVRRL